jgi:hypothetical protein
VFSSKFKHKCELSVPSSSRQSYVCNVRTSISQNPIQLAKLEGRCLPKFCSLPLNENIKYFVYLNYVFHSFPQPQYITTSDNDSFYCIINVHKIWMCLIYFIWSHPNLSAQKDYDFVTSSDWYRNSLWHWTEITILLVVLGRHHSNNIWSPKNGINSFPLNQYCYSLSKSRLFPEKCFLSKL